MIHNEWGVSIDFEVAVNLMNDELREFVHDKIAPCTEQEFFDKYCKEHFNKYGEEFELNKMNPTF